MRIAGIDPEMLISAIEFRGSVSSDFLSYHAGPDRPKDARSPPILPSAESALARAGHF
jgi:hypothetical protein